MARAVDPVLARAAACEVVRLLRAGGHEAVFAGGCVRDELLGLAPTDYDVATSARPEAVRAMFRSAHLVGEAFGVMLVPVRGVIVEVATFRADGVYSDARRPDAVHFADAPTDARRRDFTINALFLDPQAPGEPASPLGGRVIDLVGGLADLRARVLRAVGDPHRRLAEDHLRALRAVRFAARLSLSIDPGTRDAIAQHAAELRGVSRERIGEELRRMLVHPARAHAAALLAELGLDAPALDEPTRPGACPTLGAVELDERVSEPRRVALALAAWTLDRHAGARGALAPDQIAPHARRLRGALCLSNDERDALVGTLECYARLLSDWGGRSIAGQKRLAALDDCAPALALLSVREPEIAQVVRERIGFLSTHGPGIAPPALVTGDDLVAAGFVPGPGFKGLLARLYDEQLEGRVSSREGAMELARGWGV